MPLTLFHDLPGSDTDAARFESEHVLSKLRDLDQQARSQGLASLDPHDPLVHIGMESRDSQVTKNSYGPFHLAWLAQEHPEWIDTLTSEAQQLRDSIKQAHSVPLRFVIWCGMGGSAEDKSLYRAASLLKRGPRLYVLDSTDPAKLNAILDDIVETSKLSLAEALPSTLIVGQALGLTSYEPVLNLQVLSRIYDRLKIERQANFIYLALPGSLLDKFGQEQGYRKFELQLDNGNSTSGRHSSPLTRGSLLPLALAHADLKSWFRATNLSPELIHDAFRLSAFLRTQARAGRRFVTLLLPKAWQAAALWTKQNFEESLGKSEEFGIKIVIDEKLSPALLLPAKDPDQQRVFLVVQARKHTNPHAEFLTQIRRAGYPGAILTLDNLPLSHYMQFLHYVVFGIAYLERMNFVTQPSVELYKSIAAQLVDESASRGGLLETDSWQAFKDQCVRYDRSLSLHPLDQQLPKQDAPTALATLIYRLLNANRCDYFELTFFGDTRYSPAGIKINRILQRAADRTFRKLLQRTVDIYEGPAMNHSFHEMIIGHGRCLSIILTSLKPTANKLGRHDSEYHLTQFLATLLALRQRGRPVVAISLKDLEDNSLESLEAFFAELARKLPPRERPRPRSK